MSESLTNSIEIACPPQTLYDYVTQPWRWHEWHPSSKSAKADSDVLQAGDGFDEVVELEPFSPLPIRLKRATRYKVLEAVPPSRWVVKGEMKDGWLQIEYDFEPTTHGVRFTRTLSYDAGGLSWLLMGFLKPRMRTLSVVALNNLRTRLESA
ncbi:SRPBCC family protein [uncultured Abyssibacter sp.]|uniref:SRPBCC family protein n=1 Tax=uncultured Abyssibacter sp. TaxID=2320202 RepID=UPI0032B17E74|tara:strand:- start:158 stop:613 length:456 start_codon:yes stop_codon:yes gene_type:complete